MEILNPGGSPVKISDAHIWVNCPGSVIMQRRYPAIITSDQGVSRSEGKAAHQLAQWMVQSGDTESMRALVGTMSEFGVAYTQELFEAAEMYADDVLTYCRERNTAPTGIECKVPVNDLLQGAYGFCDAYLWEPEKGVLTLWEGKFGHRFVSEFDNWQLIIYTWGLLSELGINGMADQHVTVNHRVIQPRCFNHAGPVRSVTIKASDLRAQFNKAYMAVRDRDPEKRVPMCKSGVWCGDCTARYGCDTLALSVGAVFQYVTTMTTGLSEGRDLSLELELLSQASELVKARMSALEARAEVEILKGVQVPGYAVDSTKGRAVWKKEHSTDELTALGTMYGVNLLKDPEPVTPAQAKKLGVDESVIEAYSFRPVTGKKLVKISGDKYRRIFQNVK